MGGKLGAPKRYEVDRTRKLAWVDHGGARRLVVLAWDSWEAGTAVGRGDADVRARSGAVFVEHFVPPELESVAISSHVATWGALPAPYRPIEPLFDDTAVPPFLRDEGD